jgi:hypothetical protein
MTFSLTPRRDADVILRYLEEQAAANNRRTTNFMYQKENPHKITKRREIQIHPHIFVCLLSTHHSLLEFISFLSVQHTSNKMNASPLSESLATLLKSKSIQVENINIVVDNAVSPNGDLVGQALEAIIMIDAPNAATDILGLSCICEIPDMFDNDTTAVSAALMTKTPSTLRPRRKIKKLRDLMIVRRVHADWDE